MNLLAAMQLCPAFWNLLATPVLAASSISASARTMKGSLPPSSSTTFFIFLPHACATFCPAEMLPVRETAFISFLPISDSAVEEV
jgi:hypothetical protein